MLKQFSLELGEAGAACGFVILDLDIVNEGPATTKPNCQCFVSGQFALAPRNMHAVKALAHTFAYSNEKVVSSGPNVC